MRLFCVCIEVCVRLCFGFNWWFGFVAVVGWFAHWFGFLFGCCVLRMMCVSDGLFKFDNLRMIAGGNSGFGTVGFCDCIVFC